MSKFALTNGDYANLITVANHAIEERLPLADSLYADVVVSVDLDENLIEKSGVETDMNDIGFDVFIIAGQSNAVGRGKPIDNILDTSSNRVFQMPSQGPDKDMVIAAIDPLVHNGKIHPGTVGFGLTFAKLYADTIPNNRQVLLVPVANGGTGFVDNQWNPGNPSFNLAVQQSNLALTYPNSKLMGILWLQGETDYKQINQYQSRLDAGLTALRNQIKEATNTPIILGMITDSSPAYTSINNIIVDTPNRLLNCAIVTNEGLSANSVNDAIHYNAVSQRILGGRYFSKYLQLTKGLCPR
ncbi:sialate O-acetylesterase [Nodularia sp. NIES-3585]|uniref:sialate O-acetylesterase n=1 Tax=Nodularia sp. NIES-3585 TaxID=1973477 RepID=UPI001595935E|nr:sialate O-acetylesterase [Nodularia sp. NIES-3585]